jgi:hypothetical protein
VRTAVAVHQRKWSAPPEEVVSMKEDKKKRVDGYPEGNSCDGKPTS